MYVGLFQAVLELPAVSSLKEKRQIVRSLKDRVSRQFKVAVAEVDLLDSHHFAHLGGAYVSNSRDIAEGVMAKVITFIEDNVPGRIQDYQLHMENYP